MGLEAGLARSERFALVAHLRRRAARAGVQSPLDEARSVWDLGHHSEPYEALWRPTVTADRWRCCGPGPGRLYGPP